jgi:hypothetical protein
MPDTIGAFVSDTASGKPDADAASKSDDRNPGGTGEPEIHIGETINGFESESPDTERIAGDSSGGIGKRKRGRPPGSRNGVKSQTSGDLRLNQLDIAELLFSIHLMGAEILKTPELELDKDESVKLADAIKNVGQYYNVLFDPKKVAIFQLAIVAGGIYGTRLFAIRNRLASTKIKVVPQNQTQQRQASPGSNGQTPLHTQQSGPSKPGEIPVEILWGNQGAGLE